ncbi:MAG: tRNA (guanine(26)-N(2))-dimethyltransferase [Aquificaceae bacterium]
MIREGRAVLPLEVPQVVSSQMPVFYNPHMVLNRDMSLLVLMASGIKDPVVLDPMGASGIRSIRFLLEAKVKKVIYNDISPKAVKKFKEIMEINSVGPDMVDIHSEDASLLMRRIRNCHYVDIDPFGSPVTFLESGILSVRRGGILAVSATDTAVLSGTYPTACLRRYGSKPLLEAEFYHELGIRILIKKVIEIGAMHDYSLEPILSYSHRHHFRVFFRKDVGARKADRLISRLGYTLYCDACLYREVVGLESFTHLCPLCGNRLSYAGPLWLGRLWDEELMRRIWERKGELSIDRSTEKMLIRLMEESQMQTVGFYTLSRIGSKLCIGNLPAIEEVLSLMEGVRTHFSGEGFRTRMSHQDFLKVWRKIRE